MEIKHPTTNAINKQNLKEAFYLLGKCESGIVMPFEQIQRGGNETFDNFMNKADSLRFSHKTLEKEAELFNKELMKNQKLLFLSNKLNTIPDSPKAIKEFEDISSNILGIAKKCGAMNLHEAMKASFDLMLETAKNTSKLNIKV